MAPNTLIRTLILACLPSFILTSNAEAGCRDSIICIAHSDNPFEATAGTSILTGIGLVTSIPGTSNSTSETFNYYFAQSVQNDAAAFIASDGQIRGAFFESELETFKAQRPQSNLGDMSVALLILESNLH